MDDRYNSRYARHLGSKYVKIDLTAGSGVPSRYLWVCISKFEIDR